jgi:hypothetical protein
MTGPTPSQRALDDLITDLQIERRKLQQLAPARRPTVGI